MTHAPKKYYSKTVVTIPGYSYLHQHSGRVSIWIWNVTSRHIGIKPKTTIAAISAANVVQPMLVPRDNIKSASTKSYDSTLSEIKSDSDESISMAKAKLSPEQLDTLFSKLDLCGIANWSNTRRKTG